MDDNSELAFHTLREANRSRQIEWDVGNQLTLAYRGNELAGEVGEACNVLKKLERERMGIAGSRDTIDHLAEELADVVICADLIAMQAGVDLDAAVEAKFNATSEKVGLATRYRRTPVTAEAGEVSEAVTDQDVYDALHARAPGGAEVWLWLPQEADEPDNPHTARPNRTAYEVMRAALETFAARRVQPQQDAPSPDVTGMIEDWNFDMDAAPRDGSDLLLALEGGRVLMGSWGLGSYDRSKRKYRKAWMVGVNMQVTPVAWRPLPTHPALSRLIPPKQDDATAIFDAEDIKELERMVPDLNAVLTQNPLHKVYFRAGLLACREYMARFVEYGGNPAVAQSIRANWWPSLGEDPGVPRQLAFDEVVEEVEAPDGKKAYPSKPMDPSVEALPIALAFIGHKPADDPQQIGAEPEAASTRPSPEGYEWTRDRDDLGRKVRAAWVAWAETQPNPKASWLMPYDDLSEADKEADRQIGEALTVELAELAEGLGKWGDEQSARADAAEAALLAARRVQPKQDAPSPDVAGLIEAEKKGIYIASKTKHAHRWRLLRDKIGYPITSTWIDEAGDGESKDLSDLWQRCIAEASSAEVVVVYREPGDTLKGAWIELGAALASGVPVFAVGIEEFTVAHDKRIRHFNSMAEAMKVLKPMVNGTRFVALSRLTTPEQDDARDSTQATDIIASLQYRLSVAYKAKAECNDEANRERHLRLAAEASLASARADGVREASKAANEVHEYYAGVRDKTPTGTPAHDVAQEGVIASAQTWRAVAALLPDQPAAIRALINDAGGK